MRQVADESMATMSSPGQPNASSKTGKKAKPKERMREVLGEPLPKRVWVPTPFVATFVFLVLADKVPDNKDALDVFTALFALSSVLLALASLIRLRLRKESPSIIDVGAALVAGMGLVISYQTLAPPPEATIAIIFGVGFVGGVGLALVKGLGYGLWLGLLFAFALVGSHCVVT